MELVQFPAGEVVVADQPYQASVLEQVDRLLRSGEIVDGKLDLTTPDRRLTCLFHKSRPYLAGLIEVDRLAWLPLKEFPLRIRQLDDARVRLERLDPIRVFLAAVHFRNSPVLQATTDLVEIGHVLKTLARNGKDALVALERDSRRTLMFLQKGVPARIYFADPEADPGGENLAERFFLYAIRPGSSMGKIEVFDRLSIEPDPDAGRWLSELDAESQPPPPILLQVRMFGRMLLSRPFMPPSMLIGRDPVCELILDNLSVSRKHARLSWDRGHFMVSDLGSSNRTRVNGQPVDRQILSLGDAIQIGKFELILTAQLELGPDATVLMMPKSEAEALYLVGEQTSVGLGEDVTIGKALGVDVRVAGFSTRPIHARIQRDSHGQYHLSCIGKARVRHNGQSVAKAELKAGDQLVVGRSRFRLIPHLFDETTDH